MICEVEAEDVDAVDVDAVGMSLMVLVNKF